jgi:hypothetical protein
MTTSTFDESQLKAARVAGFLYLLTFAIVVAVNFGINERLMVAGNAAQTARYILAHQRLFRIGIASEASAKRRSTEYRSSARAAWGSRAERNC